jgi:hypothetical protein
MGLAKNMDNAGEEKEHNSVQHLSSQNLSQSFVSIGFDLIPTIYLTNFFIL